MTLDVEVALNPSTINRNSFNETLSSVINSFPKHEILDSSKLSGIEDDVFKFDKNDRKLAKKVENAVSRRNCFCVNNLKSVCVIINISKTGII